MITFDQSPMSISNSVTGVCVRICVCVCLRTKSTIDYLYIQNPYSLYFSFESPLFISGRENNSCNTREADEKRNIDTHVWPSRCDSRTRIYRGSRARPNNFALSNKLSGGLNMRNISSTRTSLAHCWT